MRNKQDETICFCQDIKKSTILKAIDSGIDAIDALIDATDAGIACGTCIETLEDLLENH